MQTGQVCVIFKILNMHISQKVHSRLQQQQQQHRAGTLFQDRSRYSGVETQCTDEQVTYLDSGVHLLVFILRLVVRPVLLL